MNKSFLVRVAMAMALCAPAATSIAESATGTPAATATSVGTGVAPTAKVQRANDPDRVVCKTEETIGTRLGGHKVCRTRAEWDDVARNGRDMLEKVTSHGSQANGQ